MKEKNPMPIRKFSLIGIIGLGLILLSMICELFDFDNETIVNVQTYVELISHFIGNVLFGVSLIGYFMNLRENKILKWTSLCIGIFYILNFFLINNLFGLFYDEFGLLEYITNSPLFTVYSIIASIASIFFGYAISKLGTVNKLIAFLAIIFIVGSVYVTAINLLTTQLSSIFSEIENEKIVSDILLKRDIFNVSSYVILLGIFVILFINQKGVYTKTFKIKVDNTFNPDEVLEDPYIEENENE